MTLLNPIKHMLAKVVMSFLASAGTSTTIDVIFKAGPTGGIGQNLIVFTQNSIDEIFSAEDNGAPKCVICIVNHCEPILHFEDWLVRSNFVYPPSLSLTPTL